MLSDLTNGEVLEAGEATGDVNEVTLRRIQIREAVKAHLEKEQALFPQGIKVLSLFFIDEVAKYRRYEDGVELPGEYALMVHHDENSNGGLDKNFIGIPREPGRFRQRL